MKALFLDIDGVLNCHDARPNGYCGIHPGKVRLLDQIVERTGCRIVLASAWRYMILNGSMNLDGFKNILLIHGAAHETAEAMFGHLGRDRDINNVNDRGALAAEWSSTQMHYMRRHCHEPFDWSNVALDDGTSGHAVHPDGTDLGYQVNGIPVVQPDGRVGLTPELASRVVELLNGVVKIEPAKQGGK